MDEWREGKRQRLCFPTGWDRTGRDGKDRIYYYYLELELELELDGSS